MPMYMYQGTEIHVDYGPDTPEEIEIKKQLFDLRCQYQEAADPLVKRLVDIQALKAPRYLIFSSPAADRD